MNGSGMGKLADKERVEAESVRIDKVWHKMELVRD
jgi:hypothetical protein